MRSLHIALQLVAENPRLCGLEQTDYMECLHRKTLVRLATRTGGDPQHSRRRQ